MIQVLCTLSLQIHFLSVSPGEAMFQLQPSTFQSLKYLFIQQLSIECRVLLSSVPGDGVLTVNRYPCYCETKISVPLSVPC